MEEVKVLSVPGNPGHSYGCDAEFELFVDGSLCVTVDGCCGAHSATLPPEWVVRLKELLK